MARTHGFRIYLVSAHPNRVKGTEAYNASSTSGLRDALIRMLADLHSASTHFIDPIVPPRAGEPARPTATVTVGDPRVIRDDLVHLIVETGETGSHSRATKRGTAARDLHDWSPEASHYVTFLFPGADSPRFIVIAHSIRRRDPVRRLLALLRDQSKAERNADMAAEEAARERRRANGEPLGKKASYTRFVFDVVQATDDSYIDEILGSAETASAVFKSLTPSDRGGPRAQAERTLQIRLLKQNGRELIRTTGRAWTRKQRSGDALTNAEGVSELGVLLEEQDLLDSGEAARYDTASINVRNKDGDSTTIAVDTLRDVFTYPVSDGAPSVRYYYEKIAPRVKTVARQERIPVSDIDPSEVEEWLTA